MNQETSFLLKFWYGLGNVGCNIFVATTSMFLLFFMTDILGIEPATAGFILLMAKVWDFFADPLMGGLSDRARTPIGRRRPFLLIASIPLGIGFYFLFQSPEFLSPHAQVFYTASLFILCCIFFTVFSVPYAGMTAEMSDDYNERTSIASARMMGACIGALIAGGLAMPLVKLGGEGEAGFQFMSLVFGGLISFFCLVSFFGTRRARFVSSGQKSPPFKRQMIIALKNRPFLILMITYFIQNVAIGILMSGLVYYLKYTLQLPESLTGIIFLIILLTATVCIPICGWISNKYGKIRTYKIGSLLFAFVLASIFFAKPDNIFLFYIQAFFLGATLSVYQLLPQSMLPDTIEYDELKSGMRREGIFSGIWTACMKVGLGISPSIVGVTLSFSGYSHGEPSSESVAFGVKVVFSLVTAILFVVSIFPLWKYELTEERFNYIKNLIKTNNRRN